MLVSYQQENNDNQYSPRTPEYRGHYDPDNPEATAAHNRRVRNLILPLKKVSTI